MAVTPERPFATPELRTEGDDYDFLFWWRAQRYAVVVDGIRTDEKRAVHAELRCWVVDEAGAKRTAILEWGQVSLGSLSQRETMGRTLNKLTEDRLDWDKALRYVSLTVAERVRAPRPVVRLNGLAPGGSGARRFLVEKMFPAGEVGLLYGDGGSGKSTLALAVGLAVSSGHAVGGAFRPLEVGHVLYLDWETTADEQAERFAALQRGAGLVGRVDYQEMGRRLPDALADVRRTIRREGTVLLVVDSMGLACGNVLDQEAVSAFFMALRQLGPSVTKLVLTHLSAEGARQERGPAMPGGLRYVWNYSRSAWEVRADRDDDAGRLEIGLYHRKANNFAFHPPIGLSLAFDEDGRRLSIERRDVLSNPVLVEHAGSWDRIVAAFREGDLSYADVVEETGLSLRTVKTVVPKLLERGDLHVKGKRQTGDRGRPSPVFGLEGA